MSDKEELAKRITDGMRVSKEVTETFIKALDPVGIESDKVSKITYTAKVAKLENECLYCHADIHFDNIYVVKMNPRHEHKPAEYDYCLTCACKDIDRIASMDDYKYDDEPIGSVDLHLYVSSETLEHMEETSAMSPIYEYKIKLKEVKEMTEKEVEDYRSRPMHDEEDNPEEALEIEAPSAPHIPTIMSKLTGSVDMPEEFKFADSSVFYTMLRNIYRGKSILVLGPSGCGKSSLGKILVDITAKPYYAFNFGDTMNPAAKILGDTKYDSERGTFFKKSRFVSALQDDRGSFIMLDEVTRDRTGDLANILMPVLDGQKYLALDESDDADTVDINANAFFYATANIGREYLGAAHDLDRAWKDRFTGGIYELEYLPQGKEQELLMIRSPTLDEKDAHRITDFAKRVRDLYKAEEISTAVSTRMCLSTAEFVVDGMSLIDALKQVCLPFYPIVAGDDSERVQVIQTIQSMGD